MEQQPNNETRQNGHTNGHAPAVAAPANGALDLLWDGLHPAVMEKLSEPLAPALISYRQGSRGKSVPYLEGHAVITQANEIFGYGGWGYEVVGDIVCREARLVDETTGAVTKSGLLYTAVVKVTVPGVPARCDVGCQPVKDNTPDGHDTAVKGAVTDGLKRALRSFGDRFGNGLYADNEDTITPALRDAILALARVQGLTLERLREAVVQRTQKDLDRLAAPELAVLVTAMVKKLPVTATPAAPTNGSQSTS